MTSGKTDGALSILKRIARENGKNMPIGRLIVDRVYPKCSGKLVDLLNKDMYKTSILLWLVWLVIEFFIINEFLVWNTFCKIDT